MQTDILGEPYEQHIIALPDDDEGQVVATLIRRRADRPTRRAVLYLHGFCDYFFQTHLADWYADNGWDFYALDLRKYGRSLLGHQTPNFARSITEYFPEIDEAIRIVRTEDGHDTVLLNGHSTGGLVGSLWAHSRRAAGLVDGLFLNSPFLDFNTPWLIRRPLAPAIAGLASLGHYRRIPVSGPGIYGRSLHVDHHGEWAYDLTMKPVQSFPVRLGWLRAIREAHLRVRKGLAVPVPILVTCSDASFKRPSWDEIAHDMDAVLDVEHIARWAPNLGSHVTLIRVPGGKHDLTLSRPAARERLFSELSTWLGAYLPEATGDRPEVSARISADAVGSGARPPSRVATPADRG